MKYLWKSWKLLLSSMSTFYQWFSNIHFASQWLFHKRAVDFTISLYYDKYVGSPFFISSPFKTNFQEVFHNKSVPKKFCKTNRKPYLPTSLPFPMKLKVAGWKDTVQVDSCEFWYIFKSDYVAVHEWTAASDILQGPHWRNAQCSPAFCHSFILNWF